MRIAYLILPVRLVGLLKEYLRFSKLLTGSSEVFHEAMTSFVSKLKSSQLRPVIFSCETISATLSLSE